MIGFAKRGKHPDERQKGQTLMEFAITLPILLILMFGVIEFGRIFQAWVSLQNAARVAARHASTRDWESIFRQHYEEAGLTFTDEWVEANIINTTLEQDDLNSLVPCVAEDLRGNPIARSFVATNSDPDAVVYDGDEGLFATWYGGLDCDPANRSHQQLREDILRILAITAEGHRGASGLGLDIAPVANGQAVYRADNLTDFRTSDDVEAYLYSVWNPMYPMYRPTATGSADIPPDGDNALRGYFYVMMCSSRPFVTESSTQAFEGTGEFRFVTASDENDAEIAGIPALSTGNPAPAAQAAGCFLNEVPTGAGGGDQRDATQLAGKRWLDPGGPGQRVTVVITFYHPLITPLGLDEYLEIRASRSAVVETFQNANAIAAGLVAPGLSNPSESPGGGGPEVTEEPTSTPTFTPPPPTVTSTAEAPSFDCEQITLDPVDYDILAQGGSEDDAKIAFQPNSVMFRFRNMNNTPAVLRTAELNWASRDYEDGVIDHPVPFYPTFVLRQMQVGDQLIWDGNDTEPPTNSVTDTGAIPGRFEIPARGSTLFTVTYTGGPVFLNEVMPRSAFTGTSFEIINPRTDQPCPNDLVFTSDNTETIENPWTGYVQPEDCVADDNAFTMAPEGQEFHPEFAWVKFNVRNTQDYPLLISGFEANWGRWEDRDHGGTMRLLGVYVGGSTPAEGTHIWEAPTNEGVGLEKLTNNAGTQEDPNEYAAVTREKGIWKLTGDYPVPPNASRNVWLVFNGDSLPKRGVIRSDFGSGGINMTALLFGCPPTGGPGQGGGGGTYPTGKKVINEQPTPEPTVNPENRPPVAINDEYGKEGNNVVWVTDPSTNVAEYSVSRNDGVLKNDTDCADDTDGRIVQGPVCGDVNNPTNNGDLPLTVVNPPFGQNYVDRWVNTTNGGQIRVEDDGSFRYRATSNTLYCGLGNNDTLVDEFTYVIQDARGATASATIRIHVRGTISEPNNKPGRTGNPTFDYYMGTDTVIGTSNGESNLLSFFHSNGDNDSFNFYLDRSPDFNDNRGQLTINNNGNWSYDARGSSTLAELPEGETEVIEVEIRVNDGGAGGDQCSTQTQRVKIRVHGNYQAPVGGTGPNLGGGGGGTD